jgi:hypothetical protein
VSLGEKGKNLEMDIIAFYAMAASAMWWHITGFPRSEKSRGKCFFFKVWEKSGSFEI